MEHLSAIGRRSSCDTASARRRSTGHGPGDLARSGSTVTERTGATLPDESCTLGVRLIINADDYGYFPCISRGIVDAARSGAVTATGVLANAPLLDQQLDWLKACPQLDLGAHLNLTSGTPISDVMRQRLDRWNRQFPQKAWMFGALLSNIVSVADVRVEWQAQIEACLAHGLRLRFVNSHEHIHMMPSLFSLIHDLAEQYSIEHVRYPLGEIPRRWTTGAVARNLIIHSLGWLNRRPRTRPAIPCLGVGESGRLSLRYLHRLVSRLERGRTYELMCHPGYYDQGQINDPRLVSYHAWEQELDLLTGEATRALFARHGVRLIGYSALAAGPPHLSAGSVESH